MEQVLLDESYENEIGNAFNMSSEEISDLQRELEEEIMPEIEENEKLMAQSYESMLNDMTPLI